MMVRGTARQAAETTVRKLTDAGHEALLAGGCVRDMLLGTEPKDYDVATSAKPPEVCQIYPKAQKVGAHFGVVIVRQSGYQVQVATFRTDGVYKDGRHPEEVVFATAQEDARRRDFTINGMFYDVLNDRVIDYVGGQDDLRNKLVQAIGHPEQRFEEDHLRMLRAVRFASRLAFHIEQETFEAIYHRADKITRISAERIRDELEKILSDKRRAAGFDMLCETGLLQHLWPDARWSTEQIKKSKQALRALPESADFTLALAAMLFNLPAKRVNRICRDLTCSNQVRAQTVWLIDHLSVLARGQVATLADLKLLMAGPRFDDLLHLFKATLITQGLGLADHDELHARSASIPAADVSPEPLISGDDLIEMGVSQGPVFKEILSDVYYRQLNLELRDRAEALALARELSQKESE